MRRKLLQWFRFYKRDLPWRTTREPYALWVSEIMLQQTRVAAVEERFVTFMRRFPDVQALASAPLDDVLAVWSGLGYYRRARMMHQAARELVDARDGALPRSAEEWETLPGIGRYTAAAIASIAHGEPVAVVDGNVERVLTRLHGRALAGEQLWTAAGELLSVDEPGDFNQAMMELGATVCTPKSPTCLTCPVRDFCATRGEHAVAVAPPRQRRDVAYALLTRRNQVALVQRGKNESLMPGMWELPPASANGEPPRLTLKHAITSTDYSVRVYAAEHVATGQTPVSILSVPSAKLCWFRTDELPQLPLTGLARKILRRVEIIK